MHKDILVIVLAYKHKFITLDEFAAIGAQWRDNPASNIFRVLVSKLSANEFNRLREILLETLQKHNDNPEAAVRRVGGMGIVQRHFGQWNALVRVDQEENWGVETIIDEDPDIQEFRNSLLKEGPDAVDITLQEKLTKSAPTSEPADSTKNFTLAPSKGGAPPPPAEPEDETKEFKSSRDALEEDEDDETRNIKLISSSHDSGKEAQEFAREHDGHSIFDETRDFVPRLHDASKGEIFIDGTPKDPSGLSAPLNEPNISFDQSSGFSNIIEELDNQIQIPVPEQDLRDVQHPASPLPQPHHSDPLPPPPPPPPDDPLTNLGISREEPGRYRLEGEKYRGSIGRILIGTDTHIGREVAIKELLPHASPATDTNQGGRILKDSANIRFLREARLAGQLQHPSIIPIYEIGKRADGSLYYTMRHVRGKNLGDAIYEAKSLSGRLKLLPHFLDLCNAILFAHSQGVIHRDIKPDNIMIGEFGETVVLDWGLAKMRTGDDPGARRIAAEIQQLTQGNAHTVAGQALGTPAYMAPEQARGEVLNIDEQSDIYSLGAVLYEILVGSPPWSGNVYDVLHKVVHEPVPQVLKEQPAAPKALALIAQKALEKEKSSRTRNVHEMITALEVYMAGEGSMGGGATELLRSLVSNRKKTVITACCAAFLVFLTTLWLGLSYRSASHRADSLSGQVSSAERQRLLSHYLMSQAFNEIAARMERDGQFDAAQIYASSSLKHNPTHPMSPWHSESFVKKHPLAYQLQTEAFSRIYRANFNLSLTLESIHRFNSSLVKLAVSPVSEIAALGCYDNTIRIVSLNGKFKPRVLEGHRDRIHGLDFSPDGQSIVSAAYDRSVIVWDMANGKARHVLEGHKERVVDVVWSPAGGIIASLDYSGVIILWDANDYKKLGLLNGKKSVKLYRIKFTSDGKYLVAGGQETNILMYDLVKKRLRTTIKGFFQRVHSISVSPDMQKVAASGDSNTIVMWDLNSGKMIHSLQGHTATVMTVKFSADGRRLFSGGQDNSLRVWDVETGAALYAVNAHRERVYGLALISDNVRLVTASWDFTIKVWKMGRRAILPVFRGHTDYIVKAAFSPDGSRIASSSWDSTVRIWNGKTGSKIYDFSGFKDRVWDVSWSPDGKTLAASCWDGTISLLDTKRGRLIKTLRGHKDRVFGLTWSPDGKKLISSSKDNTVIVWDVQWGKPLHVLRGHGDSVRNVAVSPRQGLIASTSKDMSVILWNLSGKKIRTIKGHKGLVSGVDFSSDGSLIATSSKDKMVFLFDSVTGKKIRAFAGHTAWVNSVRFSHDNKYLATAGDDHSVRVWDVATGHMLLVLNSKKESISAEFSPDDKNLLYGDGNDVRMVPLDFAISKRSPKELLSIAEKRSGLKLDGFMIEVVEPDNLVR